MISDQKSVRISHQGSIQKSPTNHPYLFPSWGQFPIFTLKSCPIAQLGSISKFSQGTSMYLPEHTPNYHPRKIPSKCPSYKPFKNFTQRNPFYKPKLPAIILSHHHYLKHPRPYYISHMSYTRLPWRPHCTRHQGWTHLRVQSWMQSCMQSFAGVKKRF